MSVPSQWFLTAALHYELSIHHILRICSPEDSPLAYQQLPRTPPLKVLKNFLVHSLLGPCVRIVLDYMKDDLVPGCHGVFQSTMEMVCQVTFPLRVPKSFCLPMSSCVPNISHLSNFAIFRNVKCHLIVLNYTLITSKSEPLLQAC